MIFIDNYNNTEDTFYIKYRIPFENTDLETETHNVGLMLRDDSHV